MERKDGDKAYFVSGKKRPCVEEAAWVRYYGAWRVRTHPGPKGRWVHDDLAAATPEEAVEKAILAIEKTVRRANETIRNAEHKLAALRVLAAQQGRSK